MQLLASGELMCAFSLLSHLCSTSCCFDNMSGTASIPAVSAFSFGETNSCGKYEAGCPVVLESHGIFEDHFPGLESHGKQQRS